MRETSPDHFHHIRRSRDVNSKILLIELVHNLLEPFDRFLRVLVLHEHDHVARLAVGRDQQPVPERTRRRVREILRAISQTFDRGDCVDSLERLAESLDPRQVTWRRNIARRDRKDHFRRRRKLLLDFFGLPKLRVPGGEEKILIHLWPEINERRDQREEHRG